MRAYSLRRSYLLALSLAVLSFSARGQTPDSAPASTAEAAHVQAFLDARYKASDVRYSFHTHAGQDIDCVDFFAEPGVRALAGRGQALTAIPKPPALPEAIKQHLAAIKQRAPAAGPRPEDDLAFHGQPDLYGKPQQCPEGSVPEVRITAGEIARAGGLDAYKRRLARKRPPPFFKPSRYRRGDNPNPACTYAQQNEFPGYAHVVGTVFQNTAGIAYGLTVTSIYGPGIPGGAPYHSLSQLWLLGGSNISPFGAPNCTSDCLQSIEIGWDVGSDVNPGDTTTPYLFLYSTNNGYGSGVPGSGCYNNVGDYCVPWVPLPGAQFALNQILPYTTPGNSPPVELQMLVILIANDYWISVQVGSTYSYIGYFPQSDFSSPMDTFELGGEVDNDIAAGNNNTSTSVFTGLPMGSGFNPSTGYGWGAYHHDYEAMWWNGTYNWSAGAAQLCATRPTLYTFSTTGGLSTWNQDFFFGGTP